MKNKAILLCLMVVSVSLAGCFGGSDDNIIDDEGGDSLQDWDVYHVQSVSSLPTCDSSTMGRLYYVEQNSEFRVCKSTGWQVIDLTGPLGEPGLIGSDGQDGADGADGTDGVDGADGQDGADGTNVVFSTSVVSPGASCQHGGKIIQIGMDFNSNGALDVSEVSTTEYFCNQGPIFSASAQLISTQNAPARCDAGGYIQSTGIDNGDGGGVAANGMLESGEEDHKVLYCSTYVPEMIYKSYDSIEILGVSSTHLFFENGQHLFSLDYSTGLTSQLLSGGNFIGIIHNDELFFQGVSNGQGSVWTSDGTLSGTSQGPSISNHFLGMPLSFGSDVYFFLAGDGFWKFDGVSVSQISTVNLASAAPGFYHIGQKMYFIAETSNGEAYEKVWSSDGTSSGTLNTEVIYKRQSGQKELIYDLGGKAVFTCQTYLERGTGIWDLCFSDGTPSTTIFWQDVDSNAVGNVIPGGTTTSGIVVFCENNCWKIYLVNANGQGSVVPNSTGYHDFDGEDSFSYNGDFYYRGGSNDHTLFKISGVSGQISSVFDLIDYGSSSNGYHVFGDKVYSANYGFTNVLNLSTGKSYTYDHSSTNHYFSNNGIVEFYESSAFDPYKDSIYWSKGVQTVVEIV